MNIFNTETEHISGGAQNDEKTMQIRVKHTTRRISSSIPLFTLALGLINYENTQNFRNCKESIYVLISSKFQNSK